VVEIVGVPDEEHVVVRGEDGTEATLVLAEIAEANLVVDWGTIGKRGTR
jgi:predicted DNA-binding WGR domain protein